MPPAGKEVDVEIIVSDKVRKRLVAHGEAEQADFDAIYEERNQQALAEYEHFKKMLDRVIGPDEEV